MGRQAIIPRSAKFYEKFRKILHQYNKTLIRATHEK